MNSQREGGLSGPGLTRVAGDCGEEFWSVVKVCLSYVTRPGSRSASVKCS